MKMRFPLLAILTVQLLAGLPAAQALTCTDPTIPASNPDSSYVIHADGTATDTRTGLMWKRCAEGQTWNGSTCTGSASPYSWSSALTQAAATGFAGQNDWRLPNRKELFSLVEECRSNPAINDTVFPTPPSWGFWSGSLYAYSSDYVWVMSFDDGVLYNGPRTAVGYQVRLVRGGQSFASFDRLADPAAPASVIEFYNTTLDNYFITSDPGEAAAIDGGSAGPGWIRTGNTFKSGGSTPVCRFYGSQSPGPNSHFYTVDPGECASLIQIAATTPATQPRWNLERRDFVSTPPANSACPSATLPVYRAFNGGYPQGVTPNHRITSSLTAIQQVVAHGWHNEGIVMCAPQ